MPRIRWFPPIFAALNTVEPTIVELETAEFFDTDKIWYEERLPLVKDRVRTQLGKLSSRLGNADWPEWEFSAGDLVMAGVLLRLKSSDLLNEYPNLSAFITRADARPAYQRAFAAQLAVYTKKVQSGR